MARTLLFLALLLAAPWAPPARADPVRYLDRASGMPSDDVFDLAPGAVDHFWAATGAGLVRVSAYSFDLFAASDGAPKGAPRELAPAPDGGVFALYPDALVEVSTKGTFDPLRLPFEPARTRKVSMVSTPQGRLWVLADGALYAEGEGGAKWESIPMPEGLGTPRALGINNGNPFLAGSKGKDFWWTGGHWEWMAHEDKPTLRGAWEEVAPKGVDSSTRTCLRRGLLLWCPTRGHGLARVRILPRFRHVHLGSSDTVNALARAPDGSIWCGTQHGLDHLAGRTDTPTLEIGGRKLGAVTACAVDREGRVWIGSGSSFPGVYRLEDGKWRHLGAAEGFVDGFVHRITVDNTGALWFAVLASTGESQAGGAWVFSDGKFRPFSASADLPSDRVYDVVVRDKAGVLWFATLKGLAAYEGNRVVRYGPENGLAGEKVWSLCAARDGSLWIGYQTEHGVSRLSQGEVTHYDVGDGLCDGSVWSIVEGEHGVFWFATEKGLTRYDGRRWSCFRAEDGLGVDRIWPLLPEPDGSLWIGTLGGGLVHLVPDDSQAPKTRFTAADYRAAAGHDLMVEWSGIDAWSDTPKDELRYSWRIDGGRWSRVSAATSLRVPARRGRHALEVQAIDRFGNAESPPASVTLTWDGSGYPAWPLLAGAALLLLGAGYCFGRIRRRRRSVPA